MAKKTNVTINGVDYYRLRKTIGYDRKGKPIIKPFYGDSKRDAQLKYEEWKKANDLGLKLDNQSISQAMYTWLWEIEKVSGTKLSTFDRYEGIYRNYIEKSKLGHVILKEVDKLAVQKHYNSLFIDGKTYSQIHNLNKLLNKFFNFCLEEGYMLRNPCKGIKFDAYKEFNDEITDEGVVETFSESEIDKILNGIRDTKLKVLIKFALATGLRQGEILALTTDDIEDMTVSVNKRVKRVKVFDTKEKYHYVIQTTTPKTKNSIRKVHIPTSMEADLKTLDIERKKQRLKLGEFYNDNNLLFPSLTGGYIDSRNLTRSWKRVFDNINATSGEEQETEKVLVPYKKFHALRHTYATLLLKKGTPLITVSRLLGHSTIKTTEIYAHVLEKNKKNDVEALNEILNGL